MASTTLNLVVTPAATPADSGPLLDGIRFVNFVPVHSYFCRVIFDVPLILCILGHWCRDDRLSEAAEGRELLGEELGRPGGGHAIEENRTF